MTRSAGAFFPWQPDAEERLLSRELGRLRLYYVEHEHWLRLLDREGARLPSAEEEANARYAADEEVMRLREEVRRLREERE